MFREMPQSDDDWSDSDEELSHVETSVLLGVPDGNVDDEADRIDAAVSRIGGLPVRASSAMHHHIQNVLTYFSFSSQYISCYTQSFHTHKALLPSREPPVSSSHCKSCAQPMELLVQMWCPFEDSPMDRALYIWGCARSGCQGKDGSVRAWRGLRINERYAQKLAQKRQRQLERERQRAKADEAEALLEAAQRKNIVGGNPFAMRGSGANNAPMFGLGAQIFGAPPSGAAIETAEDDFPKAEEIADDDNDISDADEELLTALAATSIAESEWKSVPSYPPLYLSTVAEYVPPPPKLRVPKGIEVEDLDDEDKKNKDISWAKEKYEDSLEVDQVFERFMNRVKHEGEQCVRYELNGTPLPFAQDKMFYLLWPAPPQDPLPVTKPAFKVVLAQKRVYDPSAVPECPVCGGPRVFECQLVPNLINVLRPAGEEKGKKLADEERRKEVEKALQGDDKDAKRGMEWGTCMVFSCKKDCCEEGGKGVKEAWREEAVYIQWDV